MFDSKMNLTTNASNATTYVYNITMMKLISGKSSSNLIISKVTTKSSILVSSI